MTTFEMLQELLAQNEFELLLPEDHTANTTEQDIRLVYQMNDTVESFLVFRKAIFTGTYKKDYEGKLDASYRFVILLVSFFISFIYLYCCN